MPKSSRLARWVIAFIVAGAAGCQGAIGDAERRPAGTSSPPGVGGGIGGGGQGGSNPSSMGGTNLPARIRRLSAAEYDAAASQLLVTPSTFGKTFTPDARQDGFTMNDAQRVDPVFAMQADDAAHQLAARARAEFGTLASCADPVGSGEACARAFVGGFAPRAYRRPATSREIEALVTLYRTAAEGASYADGLEVVVQAVLESPGFLYLTEIGETPRAPVAQLTPDETANAIAFLLTGAPPDETLRAAASANELMTSEARKNQARRLLASTPASVQVTRILEEWLGIDRITETSKDSNVFPDFARLKDAMKREADDFVTEVMWRARGDVSELLSADWTNASDDLARMYLGTSNVPARTNGRVSLSSIARRGILNQAAFLSVYAHATETAPVLRGVALLRRLACIDVPSPASLNINVVPPVPDPAKTTRERFAVHAADAVCANCHKSIDPFGFSFENLDGMGRSRMDEKGRPIDSSTTIAGGFDFDGSYADSSQLVVKMATSPAVRACFARHLFRYAAARSDASVAAAEQAFVDSWNGMPNAGNIGDVLASWVGSESFVQRRAEP